MKSGQVVLQSGLYRSQCCREETVLVADEKAPSCANCGTVTVWDLVRANGEHEEAA